MKKFLAGILVGAAVLHGFNHATRQGSAAEKIEHADDSGDDMSTEGDRIELPDVTHFHCDGRVYCSQMTSCAEAMYFLEHCPGVKMDGEGDGIPCERQWCGHR